MDQDGRSCVNHAFEKEIVKDSYKEVRSTSLVSKSRRASAHLSEQQRLQEIRSIQKNVICIAICGLLVTTPMFGLMNSTTSLLDDEGLGITSLATCSVAQFLGSAFLLSYVNKIFGVRKMISVTLMLPIPFIVSYAYPSWGTTLPAGILLGLGQAFLTSIFMYGNALGYYYAQLTKGNSDAILVAVSGLLSSCLGGGLLFGNLVLFTVFNIGLEDDNTTLSTDVSYDVCGANYCNEVLTHLPTMRKPETWRYYTMVAVFTTMSLSGAILSLFIRDFSVELEQTLRKKTEYFQIMKETLGLLKHPRGFLLIITTVFIGLEGAFVMADYTHAYISCSIGIPKVGLIMLTFGGVQIVVCISQGFFVKIFGRVAVIVFGNVMLLCCCLTVFLWHPDSQRIEIFFLIAVLWATSDAIIIPTFFAMYGILFEDNIEGSLALATFWWALGFMIAFVWSQFLCVSAKLSAVMAVGCAGLVCYLILEIIIRKKAKQAASQVLEMNKVT